MVPPRWCNSSQRFIQAEIGVRDHIWTNSCGRDAFCSSRLDICRVTGMCFCLVIIIAARVQNNVGKINKIASMNPKEWQMVFNHGVLFTAGTCSPVAAHRAGVKIREVGFPVGEHPANAVFPYWVRSSWFLRESVESILNTAKWSRSQSLSGSQWSADKDQLCCSISDALAILGY